MASRIKGLAFRGLGLGFGFLWCRVFERRKLDEFRCTWIRDGLPFQSSVRFSCGVYPRKRWDI